MLDRKQMVAEIANEVVSRLLTHLDGPGAIGRAGHRGARRPCAGPEEAGPDRRRCLRDRDEAVAAAAQAQVRVAEIGLEERGG